MSVLEIEHLSKTFRSKKEIKTVLNDVSLKVEKGDIYGILGLSGAGKSTLVRCINGLEDYDDGRILYKGEVLSESRNRKVITSISREKRREIAMIFQSFNLLQQKTVLQNVELAGSLFKMEDSISKAKEYLELVGLADKFDSYPSELSGGQQQRVAIARALMTKPEILLCDEATSALDPETTEQILELLKSLNKRFGLTILIISHQMATIEKICNKVAIISSSVIVEDGLITDVFLNPQTEIAKSLIYSNRVTTKLSDKNLIRIKFNGNADTPLITNIIQECNILVSIVYADTRVSNDKVYGQLIFKLPKYDEDIIKLKTYLSFRGIDYEEVTQNELD
jgi:D-methionine transport system ATP-binding protein